MEQKHAVPLSKAWKIYREKSSHARVPRLCKKTRRAVSSKKPEKTTLKKAA